MGQFEKSMTYLDWRPFAAAVLEVYRQNEKNGSPEYLASADVWATIDDLRQDIHDRTKQAWCRITGKDKTWFPYSVNAVSRLYFRFRKRNDAELMAFEQEIKGSSLFV